MLTKDKAFLTKQLEKQNDFNNAKKFKNCNITGVDHFLEKFIKAKLLNKHFKWLKENSEIDLDEELPRLFIAGFDSQNKHTHSRYLQGVLEQGIPFVIIKETNLPCEYIYINPDSGICEYTCSAKMIDKKKHEELKSKFRDDHNCYKNNKIGSAKKICNCKIVDDLLVENIMQIKRNFLIENNLIPIFSYSFYLNKLIWENFFGQQNFNKRVHSNLKTIMNKHQEEFYPFILSKLETKKNMLNQQIHSKI